MNKLVLDICVCVYIYKRSAKNCIKDFQYMEVAEIPNTKKTPMLLSQKFCIRQNGFISAFYCIIFLCEDVNLCLDAHTYILKIQTFEG
jgi:hypothetical protein